MEKKDKLTSYKERLIRWQQLTINQLSYTNNLIIGLNLAFIGFFISNFNYNFKYDLPLFIFLSTTFLCFGTSFISGILVVINRLKDFRKTTQLVNKRKQKYEIKKNLNNVTNLESIIWEISFLKKETNFLGKKTWFLLYMQIWSFMIGTISGIIYIVFTKGTFG